MLSWFINLMLTLLFSLNKYLYEYMTTVYVEPIPNLETLLWGTTKRLLAVGRLYWGNPRFTTPIALCKSFVYLVRLYNICIFQVLFILFIGFWPLIIQNFCWIYCCDIFEKIEFKSYGKEKPFKTTTSQSKGNAWREVKYRQYILGLRGDASTGIQVICPPKHKGGVYRCDMLIDSSTRLESHALYPLWCQRTRWHHLPGAGCSICGRPQHTLCHPTGTTGASGYCLCFPHLVWTTKCRQQTSARPVWGDS